MVTTEEGLKEIKYQLSNFSPQELIPMPAQFLAGLVVGVELLKAENEKLELQAQDTVNSAVLLSKLENLQEYYIEKLQGAVKAAKEFINNGGPENYQKWRQALKEIEE